MPSSIVWAPAALLAGSIGIWLFYVQHQFEDAYWQNSDEWGYADAALRGSSYLRLPPLLRFFTGNIGLHHVHHLNARIPNYNLPRAHKASPMFDSCADAFGVGRHSQREAQALGRAGRPAGDVRSGPSAASRRPARFECLRPVLSAARQLAWVPLSGLGQPSHPKSYAAQLRRQGVVHVFRILC